MLQDFEITLTASFPETVAMMMINFTFVFEINLWSSDFQSINKQNTAVNNIIFSNCWKKKFKALFCVWIYKFEKEAVIATKHGLHKCNI